MQATMVVDLMWGSCGKGLFCGYLAERDAPDTVVNANTPSAGHTYINSEGRKYLHLQLPNGVVSPKLRQVLLGPGSVINLQSLAQEVAACADHLQGVGVYIHENAAILMPKHLKAEEGSAARVGIGSTRKGGGEAIKGKLDRNPDRQVTAGQLVDVVVDAMIDAPVFVHVVPHSVYLAILHHSDHVLVEGAQGYSLGINSGSYPYVTSRECTPAQLCADTLVPIQSVTNVVGVARTYPIRVANRYDSTGCMIGWSGPHYPDQKELTWQELGLEPELTTVTQLERRVFSMSEIQLSEAIQACRPDEVALNFANYDKPSVVEGKRQTIDHICEIYGGGQTRYLGWGPSGADVEELPAGGAIR